MSDKHNGSQALFFPAKGCSLPSNGQPHSPDTRQAVAVQPQNIGHFFHDTIALGPGLYPETCSQTVIKCTANALSLQFWTSAQAAGFCTRLGNLEDVHSDPFLKGPIHSKIQRFSNFFQVGTTYIGQNVLRTNLLLSALKANCLKSSTIVCDTQLTLILFFLSFLDPDYNLRGPQGQNPRTTV
jgi:hypothetical protein